MRAGRPIPWCGVRRGRSTAPEGTDPRCRRDLVRNDGHRTPAGRFSGDVCSALLAPSSGRRGPDSGAERRGAGRWPCPPSGPPTANQEAFADTRRRGSFSNAPTCRAISTTPFACFRARSPRTTASRWRMRASVGPTGRSIRKRKNRVDHQGHGGDSGCAPHRPGLPEVRLSLAVMYQGMGSIPEAQEELTRVLAAQPANDDAHRLLGGIHIDRGEWPRDSGTAAGHRASAELLAESLRGGSRTSGGPARRRRKGLSARH